MFRNQYDTDVTTFSPVGRLHQVEYACEAVKQGSAILGLVSQNHAVLCALRRSPGNLGSYQKKLFKVDNHMGVGISGLVADARELTEFMREEALHHKYVFNSSIDTGRLVTQISEKSQVYTQTTEKRPYGVGLLVIGFDEHSGPHLFETSPAGVHFEFYAQAIGARSQSCKTYLEKMHKEFPEATLEDLIMHAVKALAGAAPNKESLTAESVSIAYVGKDTPFTILRDEEVAKYVAQVPASMTGVEVKEDEEEEEAEVPARQGGMEVDQ